MVLLSVLSGASASFVCTADRDKIMERGTHYTLQIKGRNRHETEIYWGRS